MPTVAKLIILNFNYDRALGLIKKPTVHQSQCQLIAFAEKKTILHSMKAA